MPTIAIVGGTGPEGRGLGLRFAMAGHPVILGSRDAARAAHAAEELLRLRPGLPISGAPNADAAAAAEWVVLSLPYEGLTATVRALAPVVEGKLVLSVVAPISFVDGRPKAVPVPDGSAAQHVAALLPKSPVITAFHHVSAHDLLIPDKAMEGDIIVCGDHAEAKQQVMALIEQMERLRAIDGGPLENASYVENLTALLLQINRTYKGRAMLRLVGI